MYIFFRYFETFIARSPEGAGPNKIKNHLKFDIGNMYIECLNILSELNTGRFVVSAYFIEIIHVTKG